MKLPSGPDDGARPLDAVVEVLRQHCDRVLENGGTYYIEKGDEIVAQQFTDPVRRRVIQYLSRKFGIDILEFYYLGKKH